MKQQRSAGLAEWQVTKFVEYYKIHAHERQPASLAVTLCDAAMDRLYKSFTQMRRSNPIEVLREQMTISNMNYLENYRHSHAI